MGNHGLGTQWQNVCWKFDWKYPNTPKFIQPIYPNQQIVWNIFEKSPLHMSMVQDLRRWFWETLKNQLFVLFWNFSHFWDLSVPSKTTLTCFWSFFNLLPYVDIFYLINVDKKLKFFDNLSVVCEREATDYKYVVFILLVDFVWI